MADIFPDRLKNLRTRKGMTQKDLADWCEVHINMVYAYEDGKHLPSVNTLCRMANVFGVSTDYLLCRTNDPRTLPNLLD